MNYNNNNLNPTSGYWNLSLNGTSNSNPNYRPPFSDLSYCNTIYLKPIIDKKQQIDTKFSTLNGKISDFGTFMNQFSTKVEFSNFHSTDPVEFCSNVVTSNDASYNDCTIKANDIKSMVTDISNNIASQSKRFSQLKADNKCGSTDYTTLQNQYQSMVQRRQEIDTIMNQYNKKNANSLIQTNIQETDMLIYTSVIWIVLGTSALYFSFSYLND